MSYAISCPCGMELDGLQPSGEPPRMGMWLDCRCGSGWERDGFGWRERIPGHNAFQVGFYRWKLSEEKKKKKKKKKKKPARARIQARKEGSK